MADDGGSDDGVPTWRVTGRRRWLPVLLMVLFFLQALARLFSLLFEPPPHLVDWLLLVLAALGSAVGVLMVVLVSRSRVRLDAAGVEVRSFRTKTIHYADIERAYRNRFSRGVVSLDLVDGTRTALPAPVAGLKDASPELDEAVARIQARVDADRAGVAGGRAG